MFICKTVMLLALTVWVGGLIFFAFVAAPGAFAVLPTPALAGNLVGRNLAALHWMGIVSAVSFLLGSLLYSRARSARLKPFALVNVLIVVMLVLTLISQFGITPRIHALRAQLTPGNSATDPVRLEFNRMHQWSTRLEGGVLVLGVAVVLLTARRLA